MANYRVAKSNSKALTGRKMLSCLHGLGGERVMGFEPTTFCLGIVYGLFQTLSRGYGASFTPS